MKLNLSVILFLFFQTVLFSQIHLTQNGRILHEKDNVMNDLSAGFLFEPSSKAISQLYHSKSFQEVLVIDLDEGQRLELNLKKRALFTEDFRLRGMTEAGRVDLQTDLGQHYKGTIEGTPGAWVALSVYHNQISALINLPAQGTYVLGQLKTPVKEGFSHIIYKESALKNAPSFICHSSELPDNIATQSELSEKDQNEGSCKTVRLYAEFDYYTYNDLFERDLNRTNAYATFLLNMTVAMYEQDNIRLAVSEVFLWTVPDGYTLDNPIDALLGFSAEYENDFNGDIGALISTAPFGNGGLAWLDVLCRPYFSDNFYARTSYSNTVGNIRQIPAYSWDLNVLVHEIGHNLGSPHTHDCFWNGNGTPIDDCAGEFDPGFRNPNCDRGPLPNRGTIMSYCHLNVGVDFALGFGPQPRALILDRIESARCLQETSLVNTEIFRETLTGEILSETVCLGDSIRLKVGDGYTYQWLNNATDSTIYVTEPGVYSVTVFDGNGCPREYKDTINMNPLPDIVLLNEDSLPCSGDTVTLEIQKDTQMLVFWDDQPSDSSLQLFASDTVRLQLLDTLTGCSNSDTIAVIYQQSPPLSYSTPDSLGLCAGDSTQLIFQGLDSIFLVGSVQASDTSFWVAPGTYHVRGYLNGCFSRDTVSIEEWPLPSASIQDSFYLCEGGGLLLKPLEEEDSTAYYIWNTVDSSYALEVTRPGEYYLQVRSEQGCLAVDSTDVFEVDLPDTLVLDYSYMEGDTIYKVYLKESVVATQGAVEWWLSQGKIVDQKTDSLTIFWGENPPDSVDVCVQYVTEQPIACQTDSFCIRVPTALILSSTSPLQDPLIRVYPNPFYDQFTIQWSNELEINHLELWNSKGQKVWFKRQLDPATTQVGVPTEELPPGVYWLRTRSDKGLESIPVLKIP